MIAGGGVQDATAAAGYHTFLCNTDGRAEHEIAFASELARRRVGGVVAVTFGAEHDALRRTLRGIPTVVFCYPPEADEERDVVWFDNVGAARLAVDYLIASGRRRIATVCGTRGYQGAQDRLQGYREALRARGLEVDPALIVDGDYMLRSGADAATRLLRVNPRPDAIFAANDLMALGALGALREAGVAVPGDIALIGLDDIPEAEIAYPQLTTVRQPAYEMGMCAGQLLMRRLQAAESGGAAAPGGKMVRIEPVLVRRATA
jgi:LacI family transcriptional regulator